MEHLPASATERSSGLADIISAAFVSTLRDHGVVEAYVFGSVADGTAGPESDIPHHCSRNLAWLPSCNAFQAAGST